MADVEELPFPDGSFDVVLSTVGKHVPPPAGIRSPALWGTDAWLGELFPGQQFHAPKQFFFAWTPSAASRHAWSITNDGLAILGRRNGRRRATTSRGRAWREASASRRAIDPTVLDGRARRADTRRARHRWRRRAHRMGARLHLVDRAAHTFDARPPGDLAVGHDPEKACPALDAGWIPIFGLEYAQTRLQHLHQDHDEADDADEPDRRAQIDDAGEIDRPVDETRPEEDGRTVRDLGGLAGDLRGEHQC